MAPIRYMMNQRQIISIAKHQASTKQQGNIARNERKKNSRKASNEVTESKLISASEKAWGRPSPTIRRNCLWSCNFYHNACKAPINASTPNPNQHNPSTHDTTITNYMTIHRLPAKEEEELSKNYIRSLENIPHKVQRRSKPNWCYITVVQSEP